MELPTYDLQKRNTFCLLVTYVKLNMYVFYIHCRYYYICWAQYYIATTCRVWNAERVLHCVLHVRISQGAKCRMICVSKLYEIFFRTYYKRIHIL